MIIRSWKMLFDSGLESAISLTPSFSKLITER